MGWAGLSGLKPWLSGLVLDPVLSGLVYRAWNRFCQVWLTRLGSGFAGFGLLGLDSVLLGIGMLGLGVSGWCVGVGKDWLAATTRSYGRILRVVYKRGCVDWGL